VRARAALRAAAPALAAATLFGLAGCGDLPRPFEGNPGATAMRLAQPPPSRLVVPPPGDGLLSDEGERVWARAVADALVNEEVPALVLSGKSRDWRLIMTAQMHGDRVIPTYTVQNPKGLVQGSTQGPAVAASDWANADPAMLHQAATAVAPNIADLLTSIEAARRQSDPNSLMNRPARVWFAGVNGAPGDGDVSLARQMRKDLSGQGEVVQDTGDGADFKVVGQVKTGSGAGKTERIEIQWIVTDARGHEAGRVAQLNDIPPGTLDNYWGDVAVVVAQQAAGGIKEVILNQADLRRTHPALQTGKPGAGEAAGKAPPGGGPGSTAGAAGIAPAPPGSAGLAMPPGMLPSP